MGTKTHTTYTNYKSTSCGQIIVLLEETMDQRSMYSSASQPSVLQTNKVLRNTYMLLAMTLAFSAVCAGVSKYELRVNRAISALIV